MNQYDERAATLQKMNRESEGGKAELYDEETVRRSIVYMREDITLIVSYLSSLNQQLVSLRRIAWVLVAVVAIVVIQRV